MARFPRLDPVVAFGIFAVLAVSAGMYLLPWAGTKDTPKSPSFQMETQSKEKVTYDDERKCNVLDLEPGRKYLNCNVFAGHLVGEYHIFYTTRAMHPGEAPETDIVINHARDRDLSGSHIECAYIIREHALPTPSASK